PDPHPERLLVFGRCRRATSLRCGRWCALGNRYCALLAPQILVGQGVGEIESQERLVAGAGGSLHQELELPRLRRIQRELGRRDEQAYLLEVRRPSGMQRAQAGMVPVAKTGAVALLQDLDAVEDAATDVGRSLKGVGAIASHKDGLLSGLQALLESLVAVVA